EVAAGLPHPVTQGAQLAPPAGQGEDAELLVHLDGPVLQVVLLAQELVRGVQREHEPRPAPYPALAKAHPGTGRLALELAGEPAEALLGFRGAAHPDAPCGPGRADAVADDHPPAGPQLVEGVAQGEAHLVAVVAVVAVDLVDDRGKDRRADRARR